MSDRREIEFEIWCLHETEGAYLFSRDGMRLHAVWVPKIRVKEFAIKNPRVSKWLAVVTMNEKLAIEKGLI